MKEDTGMTAKLPVELSEMISSLGEAAQSLADEVRRDLVQRDIEAAAERERRNAELLADRLQRRRESRRMTALLVVIGVLVAGLVGLSVSNRLLGNQNRSIIATIDSCTNAEGKCAQESRKRTAVVLTDLIKRLTLANIEVNACARTASTDTAYRACVDKALAKLNAPPASVPPAPAPTPSGVG